jgi:hypothetical protein
MAAVLDIHTLHPATRIALPGLRSDREICLVSGKTDTSGQNRYIVDPASSTLNGNFQELMFAVKFIQRVTFQLIPFREWRGSPPGPFATNVSDEKPERQHRGTAANPTPDRIHASITSST